MLISRVCIGKRGPDHQAFGHIDGASFSTEHKQLVVSEPSNSLSKCQGTDRSPAHTFAMGRDGRY